MEPEGPKQPAAFPLTYTRLIHPTNSHSISLKFISTLLSHLRPDPPSGTLISQPYTSSLMPRLTEHKAPLNA